MCLITVQKKPLEAKKDIIVYKEVSKQKGKNIYESIYNNFIWELNKLYKTDLKKDSRLIYYDEESMIHYVSIPDNLLTSISEGFHSMDKNRARETTSYNEAYDFDSVVIECKIPKGSLYYKDETGLYVSNQLIVLKEVKLKDLI